MNTMRKRKKGNFRKAEYEAGKNDGRRSGREDEKRKHCKFHWLKREIQSEKVARIAQGVKVEEKTVQKMAE